MRANHTGRVVVSNTTPISSLARIGHLQLLEQLFEEILIPPQVARELDRGKAILGDWRQLPGAACLKLEEPLDGPFLRQLYAQVDEGEAAAIALAVERNAGLILLDELAGRKLAGYHGLKLNGTLGILLEARQAELISAVAPLLDALESQNFRIGPALRERILTMAGERL